MAVVLRKRKAVHNLTADELAKFRHATAGIMKLRDNRGFGYLAGKHGAPDWMCWHHRHEGPGKAPPARELFLPWHRAYLYNYEMALRDIDPSVTLPFWDWTQDSGLPHAFGDPSVNGKANPLHQGPIDVGPSQADPARKGHTTREPGPDPLPNASDVNHALNIGAWATFTHALETQLHDRVHGWVGGDMGQVDWAAYDPIFYSHHCQIDRLWWAWQKQFGLSTMSPDLLDLALPPWQFTVRQVLNIADLKYDYVASETVAKVGGGK
jgi:tyrosinase